MSLIKGVKSGSNISIINTLYQYPKRVSDTSWDNGSITIIYKDLDTNINHFEYIEDPSFTYYQVLPEYKTDYMRFTVPLNELIERKAPYRKLLKDIAHNIGMEDEYNWNIKSGNKRANRAFHMNPLVRLSDGSIENHYRFKFDNEYINEVPLNIKKGYLDIEVDSTATDRDFPEYGEVPIITVAYYDANSNTISQFILKYEKNKDCINFINNTLSTELLDEAKQFIIDSVGGESRAKAFNLLDIKVKTHVFEEEIDLLYNLFNHIKKMSPDFVMFYSKFDMKYIIERIKNLGYSPESIICDPDIPSPIAEYFIDERHSDNPGEATDSAFISSRITYLDQLQHFVSRRAGERFPDNKLNTIGEIVAGVKKLNYSHITNNIGLLPFIDFKTFYLYGLIDVIVQHCIETVVNDIDYLLFKSILTDTQYNTLHRQSIYLRNIVVKKFYKQGLILMNNINKGNVKIPYKGGMVGNPLNVDNLSKMMVNNRYINLINRCIDEDFKSLYPNVTVQHNLSPDNIIGAIIMPHKVYKNENRFNTDLYVRSGEMIDNYCSNIPIEFANRYFNMAGIMEFNDDLHEYMNINNIYNNTKLECPIIFDSNSIYNIFSKNNEYNYTLPYSHCEGVY